VFQITSCFAVFEFENRSTPVAQPERFALVRDICLGDSNLKTNIIVDRSNNVRTSPQLLLLISSVAGLSDRALTLTLTSKPALI
jgi:hypothetical protein